MPSAPDSPRRRSTRPRMCVAAVALLTAAAGAAAQPWDLPEHRDLHRAMSEPDGDAEGSVPFDADAHRVCSKERTLRGYFDRGLPPTGAPPAVDRGPATTDPTDVLSNALDIEVAPPGNGISGSNTMTIRSNVDNLTTFTFRLRWNFTVTTCTVTDAVGSYTVSPSVPSATATPVTYGRTFTLLRPINRNQVFTVRVDYNGQLQSGIGLGSVFYGGQNGNTANPGVVCTLSEPYYAATWWPCKDGDLREPGDNSDKATLTMSITAPEQFSSVSNGLLQGIDLIPGTPNKRRFRWATNEPLATYLVFFSTSVYNTFSATYDYGSGTMPLQFYIYPVNDSTGNRAVWLNTANMLAAYRPVYGLYPFINEKYGIYQFEFSGGQEHQTFTGQGQGGAFSESVTSHELGHQWWGDNVTCKTWSDIWLNEGFATYTEAIWEERKPGSTGLPALRNAMNARRPSDANGTVYCFDVTNPGRIFDSRYSYRKAGWVLHMFRHIVGDTAFVNTLQTYRAAFERSAATTADFTSIASTVSGQNLNWFFQPWLYDVGAPVYEYGWQGATINGQNYLRLMVRQTQAGGPTFDMPVDVSVTHGSGTLNTAVRNNARTQYFLLPLPAPVATTGTPVAIDPNNWILEYGKTAVAYTAGPPKVVSTSPAPGAAVAFAARPSALTITFSDPVTVAAANFAVTRGGAAVPFTLGPASPAQSVTLDFGGPLAPGSYAVAVSDAVVSAATPALALDGEIAAASSASSLPSGDGIPGGPALFTFTVQPNPCPADFNQADGVTVQDIFDFLTAYFSSAPAADFNHSGAVSVQDIFDFLAAYFAGC